MLTRAQFCRFTVCAALLLLITALSVFAAADLRLFDAVKKKNLPLVRSLLQQRIDVNGAEGDGATALHWAVYGDDAATVDVLLAAGAKAAVMNDLGVTPLALASANGNAAVVEKLLRAGGDPDRATETGITPLMEAARVGSAAVAAALLRSHANPNAKTMDRGQTALMIAAAGRHPDVVAVLLSNGADVHTRTVAREYKVLVDRSTYRAAKSPKETGVEIEMGGTTPLLFAVQAGDLESVQLLLKAGAGPSEAAADGNTALVVATHSGYPAIAALLLKSGAKPNEAGAGYTALHAAVLRRDVETIRNLLASGADPNVKLLKGTPVRRWTSIWALPATLMGASPLLVAANYLETDVMRMLVEGGAGVAVSLPNGNTPVHMVAGAQFEKLNRPLDHVDTPTDIGDTCCERSEPRALEALRFLLEHGADINAVNNAGDTAVHLAAASGFTTIVQLLADRGANLNVKNQRGLTPLASVTAGSGQRGGRVVTPAQKKAEELLKKLGATP